MIKQSFKVTDIRPKDVMDKSKQYLMEDIAYVLKQKKHFVKVNCPACNSKENSPKFTKYTMTFVECKKCQTVFTNPRPTDAILIDFYKQSKYYKYWNDEIFPASEKIRRIKIFKPRVDRILDICKRLSVPTDTLVEVGAGFGTFLEELKSRKTFKSLIGIEPTPDLAETCRKKGLKMIEKTIEEVKPGTLKANIVVSFEVIEHLFSPNFYVKACNQILKKGGFLVLTCPNSAGFDIKTLGPISDAVDVEHLNYFNPDSLAFLLEQHGFEVIEKHTPGVLDADLVRNKILSGDFKTKNPLYKTILIDKWEELGGPFQEFLQQNQLSSNMMLVAKKVASV